MSQTLPENVRWVQVESGVWLPMRISAEPGEPTEQDKAAVNDALQHPATAVVQPFYGAGGPYGPAASHELLRRTLNATTKTVDSFFYGARSKAWGGNVAMLNGTYARSVLGQHLVDPDDTRTGNIQPALHLLQSIESKNLSVALQRPGFLVERVLRGDVSSTRALIELRERLGDGATSTGPWIQAVNGVFQISKNGAFYSEGGLFLFGTSANAILRGPSMFIEGGGNLVLMGTGITSDDSTGFAPAFAATTAGNLFLGDLYSSADLTFRIFGDIIQTRPIDGGTAQHTTGALVLRELSGAQISTLGVPSDGFGRFYIKDTDELPYYKGKDGTEHALTAGGVGGVSDHGALTGLTDDDHNIYVLADGTRPMDFLEIAFAGAATTSPSQVLSIGVETSGTAGIGFGGTIDWSIETDAGSTAPAGEETFAWSDPTDGVEDAKWSIGLARAGSVVQDIVALSSLGVLGLKNASNFIGSLSPSALTANRTHTLPDATGTLANTVTTTRGDIIRRGASADERYAIGTSGYALVSNGTDPVWTDLAATYALTADAGYYDKDVSGSGSTTKSVTIPGSSGYRSHMVWLCMSPATGLDTLTLELSGVVLWTSDPGTSDVVYQFLIEEVDTDTVRVSFVGNSSAGGSNAEVQLVINDAAVNPAASRTLTATLETGDLYALHAWSVGTGAGGSGGGTLDDEWTVAATQTGSWSTNTTYAASYRREGNMARVRVKVSFSGAPDAATNLALDPPDSLVFDTLTPSGFYGPEQNGLIDDTGSFANPVFTIVVGQEVFVYAVDSASTYTRIAGSTRVTNILPVTLGNTDAIDIEYLAPIVGW